MIRTLCALAVVFALFGSRPALSSIINKNDMQSVASLTQTHILSRLSRPVGRLEMHSADGKASYCTGTVLEQNLILTAYHCIKGKNNIVKATLRMGYLSSDDSSGTQSYDVDLSPVESHRSLDYVILRVNGNLAKKWGRVSLSASIPVADNDLFIIHHPTGLPKQYNLCLSDTPPTRNDELIHLCDTLVGSAGAPLFELGSNRVVGMHFSTLKSKNANSAILISKIAKQSAIIARLIKQADRKLKPPDRKIDKSKKRRRDYTRMSVFFATDRAPTGEEAPSEYFGFRRSSGVTYGICEVSIPKGHKPGVLETPSWWKLEFSPNPDQHVVLLKVKPLDKQNYFDMIKLRMKKSAGKRAFIFIHGYNVTFNNAARRTAQMSFDLGFQGAPVFYSWPSKGEIAAYSSDGHNVKWAAKNLKRFLKDFVGKTDAQEIFIIAHSMGNRALTSALASLLQENPSLQKRFKEIILAAPDIDADIFKDYIAPQITGAAENITLYASADDLALGASSILHGGHPRAGEAGKNLLVIKNIETIDATGVDTSMLAHSYFAETKSILNDLKELIKKGRHASQRKKLHENNKSKKTYWSILKNIIRPKFEPFSEQ